VDAILIKVQSWQLWKWSIFSEQVQHRQQWKLF